jgi:peroxiredoxin
MPHLEKVYEQVKDQNVAVLGVCVWDEKDAFNKWTVAKKGVYTFPVAFDPLGHKQGNIGELFKTPGIPAQFVIGADGKVAANFMGYTDGDHQLEDVLTKLGVKVNSAQ